MVHIISANEVYSVEVAKLRWYGVVPTIMVVLRHYYAKQRQMSGGREESLLCFCLSRESAVFQQSGSFSTSSLKIRSSKSKQNRLEVLKPQQECMLRKHY